MLRFSRAADKDHPLGGFLDEYNPDLEKLATCLALVEAADSDVDAANDYTVFINR